MKKILKVTNFLVLSLTWAITSTFSTKAMLARIKLAERKVDLINSLLEDSIKSKNSRLTAVLLLEMGSLVNGVPVNVTFNDEKFTSEVSHYINQLSIEKKVNDGGFVTPVNVKFAEETKSVLTAQEKGGIEESKKKKKDKKRKKCNLAEFQLHKASKNEDLPTIEALIKSGTNKNAQNNAGRSPLHTAVGYLKLGSIKLLLELGANVNAKTKLGITSMHILAMSNIHEERSIKAATILMLFGYDLNLKTCNDGWSALHMAVACGNIDLMKFLFLNGADYKDLTSDKKTILDLAIQYGQKEIIDYLISNSLFSIPEDYANILPLALTSEKEMNELVERNDIHELMHFVSTNKINKKSSRGKTILHIAVANGQYKIVKKLLELGADPNATSILGITPLHVIAYSDKRDAESLNIAKILIYYGANLESRTNTKGWTPLHVAAGHGNKIMVECFLNFGSDYTVLTKDSETVLDLAKKYDFADIVQYLETNIPK